MTSPWTSPTDPASLKGNLVYGTPLNQGRPRDGDEDQHPPPYPVSRCDPPTQLPTLEETGLRTRRSHATKRLNNGSDRNLITFHPFRPNDFETTKANRLSDIT